MGVQYRCMCSLSLILNCNRCTLRYFGLQPSQDGCWHDVEWEAKDDRWCNYEEEDENGLSPWDSINTCGKNERLRVSCNMVFTCMSKFDFLISFTTWRDKSIFLNVIWVVENWHILNACGSSVYTLCNRPRRDYSNLVYEKYTNCLTERIQERVRFPRYNQLTLSVRFSSAKFLW